MGRSFIITQSILFSLFGVLISIYALIVEFNAEANDDFEALCDVNSRMSCSKVFLSEYGKIFSYFGVFEKDSFLDQPNAVYGVLFYLVFPIIIYFSERLPDLKTILLFLSTFSMILSSFLSYILFGVLEDICLVCFTTYIINFVLFLISISNLKTSESQRVQRINKKNKRK